MDGAVIDQLTDFEAFPNDRPVLLPYLPYFSNCREWDSFNTRAENSSRGDAAAVRRFVETRRGREVPAVPSRRLFSAMMRLREYPRGAPAAGPPTSRETMALPRDAAAETRRRYTRSRAELEETKSVWAEILAPLECGRRPRSHAGAKQTRTHVISA